MQAGLNCQDIGQGPGGGVSALPLDLMPEGRQPLYHVDCRGEDVTSIAEYGEE